MRLVLHIFKKDCRHHWPEIFISLVLLCIYTSDQPRRWTGQGAGSRVLEAFLAAVPALLILTWLFLLVRVVHDESLVGDRQFWSTRPYTRTSLLFAKILMAAIVIHIPLLIAQMILLKMAFFPLSSASGLLTVHLGLFFVLVLYGLALGSITSGIVQVVLSLLVGTAGLVAIGSLFEIFPSVDFTSDFFAAPLGFLLVVAGGVVTIVQYASMRTWLSRLLFVGVLGAVAFLMLLSLSPRIINRYLPRPTAEHPLPAKFTFDRTTSFAHQPGANYSTSRVMLEFPLLVENVPDDTVLQLRAVKLDLDLPERQWSSGWRSSYDSIESGRSRTWPDVQVPNEIFSSPSSNHVRGRISLALDVYRIGKSSALSFEGEKLHFADGSRCTIDPAGVSVKCFSAIEDPSGFALYSDLPNATCPAFAEESREPWAALPATYFNFSKGSSPDVLLSPISQFEFSFSRRHTFEDLKSSVPVCASTKFLFATLKYRYTTRAEIELGDIKLLNYLPTFPRKIIPPGNRPSIHEPSDTLSLNFSQPNLDRSDRR